MFECDAEARGCAVVEDVDAVLLWWVWNFGEKSVDGGGDIVESVRVIVRDAGEAKGWEIRRDDAVVGREDGDQVAVLVGRRWVAMKKQDRWGGGETSFAIENVLSRAEGEVLGHCREEGHDRQLGV